MSPANLPDPDVEMARRLEAEGRAEEAMRAYEAARSFRDAARLAWALGKREISAQLSAEAGLHYEAGLCWLELGDPERALHHLVRTSPDDPRYRDACVRVVDLADRLDRLDLRIDGFLTRWLSEGPRSSADMQAWLRLAPLYTRHGFGDVAERMLARLDGMGPAPDTPALMRKAQSDNPLLLFEPTGSFELSGEIDLPLALLEDEDTEKKALEEERAFRARKPRLRPLVPAPVPEEQMPLIEEGATIAGRYRLLKRLGAGGMAIVWEAQDLELEERVALKVLKTLIEDENADVRFRREVSLARRLTHPNITKVFDIGTIRGHKFITMELLEGRDLENILEERQRLSPKEAVAYLVQICAGLQAAHDEGVVHRDLKPPNFFVTADGTLKVMDFGIAKHMRAPRITASGIIMGTPEYISPEQISDFSSATHLSDLYAVGVVAYRMLTGTPPFLSDQPMDLLAMHLHLPPPAPREHNPELPEALERIILRLLEKQPEERYPSCKALVADLEALELS